MHENRPGRDQDPDAAAGRVVAGLPPRVARALWALYTRFAGRDVRPFLERERLHHGKLDQAENRSFSSTKTIYAVDGYLLDMLLAARPASGSFRRFN